MNDPNITWAAQIKTLSNSPNLAKQRPLKDTKPPVMQVILDRFIQDRNYKTQNPLGDAIPFEARHDLIFHVDSIDTFDPETYEEKVEVEQKTITAEDLYRLRLVENWFWDDRQQRLIIRLDRYAPIMAVYSDEGGFRYDRPIFYRKKIN